MVPYRQQPLEPWRAASSCSGLHTTAQPVSPEMTCAGVPGGDPGTPPAISGVGLGHHSANCPPFHPGAPQLNPPQPGPHRRSLPEPALALRWRVEANVECLRLCPHGAEGKRVLPALHLLHLQWEKGAASQPSSSGIRGTKWGGCGRRGSALLQGQWLSWACWAAMISIFPGLLAGRLPVSDHGGRTG